MKALTFTKFGAPDVLEYIEVPKPIINEHEILIKTKVIGLNFADIYRRKGNYQLEGQPPYINGYEGAGIIIETKTEKYKIGDRIAFADVPFANAEYVIVPESHAISIPSDISFSTAATVLLQGLTAYYLSNDSHKVKSNEIVLIHAAAGGVGQILTQICKSKGAIVIGLTREAEKLNTILTCKADYAILLDSNWKSKIMEITNTKGVDIVFDSIGSTLMDSFDVTKDCGHVVFYGMSGGNPKPIDPKILMNTSKTLTGGDLWSYLTNENERKIRAEKIFELIRKGILIIKEPVTFKLSEGRKAHEFLENGFSSSKILLIPD